MIGQPVEYGWRLSCAHPGCTAHMEQWSVGGLPHQDLDREGWFVKSVEHEEIDWTRRYRYVAFCPEHAAKAFQWKTKMAAWDKARWEFGKETHTTLFEKFRDMTRRALRMKVGQTVEEWIAANPSPTPPWEASCS